MRRIAFCNNKGGVGKTTTCFNTAGALSELSKKILFIDMDQQASLSLHASPSPSLHSHYENYITVEWEEIRLVGASSVSSTKRLVRFSYKPLSFAAPPCGVISERGQE